MGDFVEIFFPTRRREGVTEEEFLKEQKSNWKRGILFGMSWKTVNSGKILNMIIIS